MLSPLKIFIIYAREDAEYKEGLIRAFRLLKRQGLVEEWHDGNIKPGAKWEEEIGDNLRHADVILPLISYDFFGSDYIQNVEIEKAFERFEQGDVKILPVIVRKCAWQDDERFARLQALPRDSKPVSTWTDKDEAYTDIIESLKVFITDIYAERAERRRQEEALARQREKDEQERRNEEQRREDDEIRRQHAAEEARRREEVQQRENEAWQNACDADTIAAYQAYLNAFQPSPAYYDVAMLKIKRLNYKRKSAFLVRYRAFLLSSFGGLVLAAVLGIAYWKANEHASKNKFSFVQGGTFQMGDLFEDGDEDEKPVHTVTVGDFYISKSEVTFEEFDIFCEFTGRDKSTDEGWGRGRHPVINVDWYDAIEYCNWLSQQENRKPVYIIDKDLEDRNNLDKTDSKKWTVVVDPNANGYRLPTEAEWEYAARVVWVSSPSGPKGGERARFGNGRDIADPSEINFHAGIEYKKNYSLAGESRIGTVAVDELSANGFGLYHMSGNVWEWCWDWYDRKYYGQTNGMQDPKGAASGESRVIRGGSWFNRPYFCRSAYRNKQSPITRSNGIGFRLVR